jgi:hypothetical protein
MNDWRQNYSKLQEYIAQHPQIEISLTGTCIPDEVRPEYYRLFDEVRSSFVREAFAAELIEAAPLSAAFMSAEKSAVSGLKLQSVIIDKNVRWFLEDPTDGLTRRLFDPVYDLVRGVVDTQGFEQKSSHFIRGLIQKYTRQGYVQWTALSLVPLLAPDQAYTVPMVDESIDTYLASNDVGQARFDDTAASFQGRFTQMIPDVFPAQWLALDSSHFTPLLVPKIIFHSTLLDTFVAMRTDYHLVTHNAFELFRNIKTMEWNKIKDVKRKYGPHQWWPDISLSIHEDPAELRISADATFIMRPDVIVDVMETADWYKNDGLDLVKRHCEIFRPRFGCFVVCREAPPETAAPQEGLAQTAAAGAGTAPTPEEKSADAGLLSELPDNIHLLNVGFDATKLEPIIAALAEARSSQKKIAE